MQMASFYINTLVLPPVLVPTNIQHVLSSSLPPPDNTLPENRMTSEPPLHPHPDQVLFMGKRGRCVII